MISKCVWLGVVVYMRAFATSSISEKISDLCAPHMKDR